MDQDTSDTITISGGTGKSLTVPSYITTNSTANNIWSATGPYVYTTNNTWSNVPYISNGTASSTSIKVAGDAEFEGDVTIKGKNLLEFMETIEKRLAILVPDPAKLEHFEALKKAYNHYKVLEALCELPTTTNE